MSDASVPRKAAQQSQSSASGHTQMTSRQPYISKPIASKHVCFYKSGDAQFSGLPVVINNRTFRTFDALLDSLSKRVPLPFGVRTVTTPRGHTVVRSLDQLHHGHSYICSDRRTVKPVDLERAQRKLPPWYYARPVSAQRLTLKKRNPDPRGTRSARRNEHDALLHTPKRLVVFRNGELEVKHTLILQKRTTQSFDSLLQYMSEVMSFPVLRLHTPDGRRVDGLPALILCSGVVVAAGREHFKKRNYDIQKTSPPTWLPAKRVGRLHPIERKKKSSISKSRPFSPSSERYVVEQIHNSIARSIPSNPAGSLESGQPLDSVAETDMMVCLDDRQVTPEDDIEKSFRVNQDGSMTVEMKVRLTIKEEETINWTTTVSRSSVTNQIKALSDFSIDLDAHLPALDDPVTTEANESDSKNAILSGPEKNCEANEQMEMNERVVCMEQPSSPLMQSPMKHQTQAYAESIRTITVSDIQENSSYKGQLDNGEMVHCDRPIPRPRGTLITEVNTPLTTLLKSSSFTTSEVLKQQENIKEVCEMVLHIFEKQTCQENLSGNMQPGLPRPGTSPDASPPLASSDMVPLDKTSCSFSADVQPETLATYKHQSTTKQLSPTHKPDTSTNNANTTSTQQPVPRSTPVSMSQKASVSRSTLTSKRKPVRVIVKKNYLLNTANLERKRKDSKVDILKEIRKIRAHLFNQTGAVKLKEHFRAKAVRKRHERRNKTESEPLKCSDSSKMEDPILFLVDSNPYKALQKKNILHAPQTSKQEENNCQELCKAMYLPAVHSSSSLMNEYVELWLQKSQAELTAHVEPQTTTEPKDPKIKEDGKERDEMPEYSVFNPESVLRKAVSMRHSCVNTTSKKSSLNGPLPLNMMSGHELTPVPLKQSAPPVNPKDEKILETPSASGRSADKDTSSPINTPQGNSQPSQPSLETIPRNNTMVKASLFNNQPAEKTQSTKGLMDMKETPIHASHIKKPAQEKVQINSEQVNQISELMNKPSYDTENGTSLKTIKDIQTQPSSEWGNAHAEKFYTVKMAVSPDMKPVLDQLCHILQSLREITQLRLKKSKSVPDFSSCLESTFGSSSRILLAFLSIMTLKDGLQRLQVRCQASCSEAMLMLRSLKVIARRDDPVEMRQKLIDLHTSASLHLLQRWKSFQELCNTAKSHTNGCESHHRSSSEEEDQAIQVLMGDLGVPEKVREELAAICNQLLAENMEKVSGSPSEIEENIVGETMTGLSDYVLEDYVNQYVTSVIDKAINAHLRESSTPQIFMAESLSTPDKETTLMTETHKKENSILGSDICEDMSSIGSSFGMGLHEELDLKRTEDRERLEDEKTKEDEMRVERLRGIVEQTGRLEENNSVVENYKPLEVMRRVSVNRETKKDLKLSESLVSCEAIPAPYEGFVCFPNERSFSKADHLVMKHTMSNDNGEQTCSEILGQSQMKPQTLQTQVQIHNPTRIDIVLPEEHVIIDTPQCYTIYQENFPDEVSEYEENEIGFMEEKTSVSMTSESSVTKLISSLNDQKRLVDKMLYNTDQMSDERFFNHINVENLRPKTTTDNTSMDPLSSSLAFSYDTKTSTLARDPEANIQIDRVKSIREMFLAKSNPDIWHRPTHLTTSSSDPSEFLDSIEHQLSISKDDKDACRLAIAKGYVKQAIERLYGKGGKGSASDDNRPSSAHKAKKREGHKGTNVTSLASIHEARTNATSEPSYFNATDCVTLKARPGSNDAVLIDKGRWLLRQNQTSPESSLQLKDTYKDVKEKVVESDLDLGKEDAPYSIFGPMTPDRVPPFTEREEHEGSTGTPFTYFHLPNASDPEMETENAKKEIDNTVTPLIKSNKGWAEKHGILTVFSLPDIKKANKVQPMTEATPPVVSQPTKGPSVQTEISKRSTEPDALEILYVFCGQHCPLL